MQGKQTFPAKLLYNLYYIIKIGTQNHSSFHKVCLHTVIIHYRYNAKYLQFDWLKQRAYF